MFASLMLLIFLAVLQAVPLQAELRIEGQVTNDNNVPIAAAMVTIRNSGTFTKTLTTGADGRFQCIVPGPGVYIFRAEREGHFRLEDFTLPLSAEDNDVHLVLNPLRENHDSVQVTAAASRVDFDRPGATRTLSGAEMFAIPFPASNSVKNAMRVLPTVVQDPKGGIHNNGAPEEQTLFTLNGFMVNDPLSGRFESRLGVEAIQSVDIAGGAVSAEYGKGVAGAVAITTAPGDDKVRYSATNFFPGIESRKRVYLGNWSPRFNLSGPIMKGRAWFSDSFAVQFDREVIQELPNGADELTSTRFSNLLYSQFNITPSNILFAGVLTNFSNAPRNGLSVLTPPESTVDRRSRQWFYNVKLQSYFSRGAVLETGFAFNRTFGREIPQGHDFLRITPDGNQGNSYFDAVRKAGREQALMNYLLPTIAFPGAHQLKTGIDLDRVSYWQDVHRTGYLNIRADGSIARRVVFGGSPQLQRSSFETSAYLLDTWRIRPGLLLELGLRADRDSIIRNWNASPRAGFVWAPVRLRGTKISGAFSKIYDTANLRLFTRPYDQYTLTSLYAPDGSLVQAPAAGLFVFGAGRPRTPRSRILSIGAERMFRESIYVRVNVLSRRVTDGFTYAPIALPGAAPADLVQRTGVAIFDNIYTLSNGRRDSYDHFEITLRQSFRGQYGWLASYVRSRALSNGVVDLNIDDPIVVTQNEGPMPWDSPHRFLNWSYLPLWRKDWAIAHLMEMRTGFPYSNKDQLGSLIGPINSFRFPVFFSMNLHLERRFAFRGHRWELRGGFNNLTGHKNPTLVNSNIDSANYGVMYGSQGRSLNFRIRWLGRVQR